MHLKILTVRMCLFVVPISAHIASGAQRGGKHALQHAQMTTVFEGTYQFFGSWFSDVNGVKQRKWSASMVEPPKKYTCLAACASQGRLPSLLAMTHVRWLHCQGRRASTDSTQSVVPCVGGLRAWPIETCSNKDGAKVKGRPRPFVNVRR